MFLDPAQNFTTHMLAHGNYTHAFDSQNQPSSPHLGRQTTGGEVKEQHDVCEVPLHRLNGVEEDVSILEAVPELWSIHSLFC